MASHRAPPGGVAPVGGPSSGGSHELWLHDVAAYAMNALPPDEELLIREHIVDCPECQQELAQLREVTAELGNLPEAAFIDGPPENAEFLIRGTLRRIRAENERTSAVGPGPAGRPRFRDLAVAAAAVVLAVTAGAVIGRSTAPAESVAIVSPPAPSATATVVPGTVQATSTDPRTGVRLTAQIVPAEGWVRVTAATAGIKVGQKCTLYVVSRSGDRVVAGSWLVSKTGATQGTTLQGSALTAPADVAAVEVENSSGEILVRTGV
jgi:hypothetical protein